MVWVKFIQNKLLGKMINDYIENIDVDFFSVLFEI